MPPVFHAQNSGRKRPLAKEDDVAHTTAPSPFYFSDVNVSKEKPSPYSGLLFFLSNLVQECHLHGIHCQKEKNIQDRSRRSFCLTSVSLQFKIAVVTTSTNS